MSRRSPLASSHPNVIFVRSSICQKLMARAERKRSSACVTMVWWTLEQGEGSGQISILILRFRLSAVVVVRVCVCICTCQCVVSCVNILHSVLMDARCSDTWSCLEASSQCGTALKNSLPLSYTHTIFTTCFTTLFAFKMLLPVCSCAE